VNGAFCASPPTDEEGRQGKKKMEIRETHRLPAVDGDLVEHGGWRKKAGTERLTKKYSVKITGGTF